jgi:antitoxin ParD1/3/4
MADKITKNISLTAHLDQFIDQRVQSGRYQSASEVVRESLRLMEERDAARESLRGMIEEGWQEAQKGQGRDGPTAAKEMRQALIKKLKTRKNGHTTPRRKA